MKRIICTFKEFDMHLIEPIESYLANTKSHSYNNNNITTRTK